MAAPAMPGDQFWDIIERNGKPNINPGARMETLGATLRELTLEEIISFEVAFRHFLNKAYTWDLWGAAYVIHGGCSGRQRAFVTLCRPEQVQNRNSVGKIFYV